MATVTKLSKAMYLKFLTTTVNAVQEVYHDDMIWAWYEQYNMTTLLYSQKNFFEFDDVVVWWQSSHGLNLTQVINLIDPAKRRN